MFFILSKILDFMLMPITWVFALLLIAVITKNIKRKKRIMLAALATLYLFSNKFIFDEAMRLWEEPAKTYEELERYDMAIVLGGMVNIDLTYDRLQFSRGSDRFLQALDLYKKGIVKKIFISGGSGSLIHPKLREGPLIARYIVQLGIPEEDILTEGISKNTYENAVQTKKVLTAYNMENSRLLLVTSGFHLKRAKACFEKAGLEVETYAADRYTGERRYHFDHLLLPDAETFFNWEVLLHEWVGFVVYKIMGYC